MTDIQSLRFWPFLVTFVSVAVISVAIPHVLDRGIVFMAGLVLIDMVIAMAFNFLFRTIGILSFGQAMFVIVGAYGAGILIKTYSDLSFLPALLAAGAVSGLVALVVGYISLQRIEGTYFAVLTLAFSSLAWLVVGKLDGLGREDGLTGITRPDVNLGFATISLNQTDHLYYFIAVVCLVLVAVIWMVTNSQFGRASRAIRLDAQRAEFLGINIQAYKLAAFVFAGTVTGIVSGLLGPWVQVLTPELGHWMQSTKPVLHALLGGAGFFWGPALGAVLFAVIAYATRTMAGLTDLITGGLLLIVVLAFPGGILGLANWLVNKARGGRG
ncbi:branched-chain amino acid ABC transporter permease [Aminobacter aminovorans]|uniref:ABC branched chain amino acid transporter, inner membrane subunit n=1 Tax=Aminobacter aminovorans TaxID=83263 RepID=A0AAC9ATV2_AMIAI|nr:branched-chain amino acid ABC transporter permease [Aminobacter aminovorans]AMS45509.1 ABC branched chain amino acid transporter, inner membrane subunit [Aminobacter aminovorans]MBB3708584.1 branched-chain amino acid transport system permease protein [Aminobacter aminovorans]